MNSDLSSFASLAPAYPELLLAVGIVVLLVLRRRQAQGEPLTDGTD